MEEIIDDDVTCLIITTALRHIENRFQERVLLVTPRFDIKEDGDVGSQLEVSPLVVVLNLELQVVLPPVHGVLGWRVEV